MNAIITDIQHFSLHDGDGIRTTVFLKGCNMRCAWCHNPETLSMAPQEVFYPAKCVGCGHCKTGCPSGARTVIGQEKTVDEVLDAILADKAYYSSSRGGVTVSGGEPLMQADFTAELLAKAKAAGLSTAIETNLSLPWEQIEKLVPSLDMLYFDLKLIDPEAHHQWTGISNEQILQNAEKISRTGIPFIVRTPLIPGATDSDENIAGIARFVASLPNCQAYELLNYNMLAKAKYEPIGMVYTLPDARPLSKERLEQLRAIGEAQGALCRVRRG